jgi:hypothetical protein
MKLTEDQHIIIQNLIKTLEKGEISPVYTDIANFHGFTTSKVQRAIERAVRLSILNRQPLVKNGLKLGKEKNRYKKLYMSD